MCMCVKVSSRRNAWGNLSYADLITKAIESTPDKRLTLSQIYAWMVANVPFFKDKGDSNSSAGWKVHCQFLKMSFCRDLLYIFMILSSLPVFVRWPCFLEVDCELVMN